MFAARHLPENRLIWVAANVIHDPDDIRMIGESDCSREPVRFVGGHQRVAVRDYHNDDRGLVVPEAVSPRGRRLEKLGRHRLERSVRKRRAIVRELDACQILADAVCVATEREQHLGSTAVGHRGNPHTILRNIASERVDHARGELADQLKRRTCAAGATTSHRITVC